MPKKRHKAEEIVAKLRQVEVLTAQGKPVAESIRSIGVTEVSFATSYSTAKSFTPCKKPKSSSKAGGVTTTPCANTHRSVTNRQLQRRCYGRLRYPVQLRRPHQP